TLLHILFANYLYKSRLLFFLRGSRPASSIQQPVLKAIGNFSFIHFNELQVHKIFYVCTGLMVCVLLTSMTQLKGNPAKNGSCPRNCNPNQKEIYFQSGC